MFARPIIKVAFRDLRRNLGMSILAVLLIATPVTAITLIAAMFQTSTADDMARQFPDGRQATIRVVTNTEIEQSAAGDSSFGTQTMVDAPEESFVAELERIVAPNAVAIEVTDGSFAVLAKGPGFTPIETWNLAQQVSESEVVEGRLPGDGEVALAERDALLLGASIGDTVLDQGIMGVEQVQQTTLTVVATGLSQITLVSPALAEDFGLDIDPAGAIIEFEDPLGILDTREFRPHALLADNTVQTTLVNQAAFDLVAMPLGIGAIFVLIAIGVTTAVILLSARAARNDMDTLSAIGAAPGTRRKFTVWLGVLIVVAGTLPGLLAGLVATRAISMLYRTDFSYGLLPMLLVVLVLVAITTLVGTLFPPRTRGLTRRMD